MVEFGELESSLTGDLICFVDRGGQFWILRRY